jgi:peptidyl-dipeptidase Dcp
MLLSTLACSLILTATPPMTSADANPLLAPWTGPYGGVPAFDQVKVAQFKPALEAAMTEALAAADAIARDPAPATFDNTIVALERSSRTLGRVGTFFGVWGSTLSTPEFQAVETEMAPRLAAFGDKIVQNEQLFARVDAVHHAAEAARLTPEQRRLVLVVHQRFVRAGARLDAAAKKRVAAINERLATLYTAFSQNLLAEEGEQKLVLARESDLAGLPPSYRAAAADAATAAGLKGQWVVLNTRSSVEPFLTNSTRRDLRQQAFRMFTSRGDHGDARDNKKLISEMVALRGERARLLGYPTFAHWNTEDSMARTPERALALMEAVWPAAVARVAEEVADMQAVADREGAKLTIEPWDYRFYAEKVRQAKYDLDGDEVKPYLQLEKLREGMFWVAGQLFGLQFSPAAKVPVPHPDVRVWEVRDAARKLVGLWYFDPYARTGKRSGAWMNAYRNQERFDGEVTTIVSNNSNFVKGTPGQPVLIGWDDADTLFHEFGHALHGLCSSVTYPSVSGTDVARDYVEFPSQILERWLSTPELLERFARHVTTGAPMPRALLAKIEKASRFNQGFATVEYLSSALVDMKLHLATGPVDPAAFERETLAAIGMPRQLVMRHRLPQFSHLFSSDGYAAGYYAYLWADTISADAYEAFTEATGPYDAVVAKRLKDHVFSVGNTVDPVEGYRAFRGRDAGVGALMRHRGFPETKVVSAPVPPVVPTRAPAKAGP